MYHNVLECVNKLCFDVMIIVLSKCFLYIFHSGGEIAVL